MDFVEGVGESSSPERSFGGFGAGAYDVRNDVYNRLVECQNEEAVSSPQFREQLEAHFNRLPASYGLDINMDRVEDVLLHQKLLAMARDPEKRPVFHIRLLESSWTKGEDIEDQQASTAVSFPKPEAKVDDGIQTVPNRNFAPDIEPCRKLEDLNLDVRKYADNLHKGTLAEDIIRPEISSVPIHEIIFSTIDKPKLLSQLSALLSNIGLNIREAHVFSTTDGYSLDVFVVDGWPVEDPESLTEAVGNAINRSEGSWTGSLLSQPDVEKTLAVEANSQRWEIDTRLIKMGEKIASGSCGDLYRGVYIGHDVAVKILRSEHLSATLEEEFSQEVAILSQVEHRNVVRFIGACTKLPQLSIVTEYMHGGSLYDYLHKNHNNLKLPQLLKFAIDVCKGMEYLHQNNIVHRDLKTANLLMDSFKVVKVADFGVARFHSGEGVMTAETGTYRWMAPEVINHQPYDQKADVFSFAIVLWELVTARVFSGTDLRYRRTLKQFDLDYALINMLNLQVPYETMTPLQAALGVREGLRPELPKNAHPKLLDLMQKCWKGEPSIRPSFSEILVELVELLQEVQEKDDA